MSKQEAKKLLALAEEYLRDGRLDLSELLLRELLNGRDHREKALELLAYVFLERGRSDVAEDMLLKASALPGCSPRALFYLGTIQLRKGLGREAIASFQRSIKLKGDYFEALHELGVAHEGFSEHESALQYFRRAERENPRSPALQHNLGSVLVELGRFDEAIRHFDRAISLAPDQANAWVGRGTALASMGRLDDALGNFDRACALSPEDITAWINRAITLVALGREHEARESFERLARLPAETDHVRGSWLYEHMLRCRWDGWRELVDDIVARVDAGEDVIHPFYLLALPAGRATQLACARAHAVRHFPSMAPAASAARPPDPGRRVRIGYFSADFYTHATSQLIVRLFECHARDRFETFGYFLGTSVADDMTRRVAASLEHFTSVQGLSDADIAAKAREAGLDIAISLNGLSSGAQPGVFAHRAAPVQVNFLGYPGTMGCAFIDYIIADATLIRPDEYEDYEEKVVVLPGSYQPNDDRKAIGDSPAARETMGLPADGFVFACFNNSFKITPDVFDVWMHLLGGAPGSVLWLLKTDDDAKASLRSQAQKRGVDPERLVWAERLPLAEHLARHAHADLFLDTFHYNAHTTASDALWAGLPVLTLAGPTFASRVSASLLRAIGLPELITSTVGEYAARALELTTSPSLLAEVCGRLAEQRHSMPLFDSPLYATRIEAAFETMWNRHLRGLRPDHIVVPGA